MTAELDFYAAPGRMTDLGAHRAAALEVAPDIASVARAVQGTIVHIAWAQRYGIEVGGRAEEVQARHASHTLDLAGELATSPLGRIREPDERVFGNCRHFSTLAVAILRAHGVPSRARAGYGTYFNPGGFEDHWIVEWWNGERWVGSDTQLDEFQANTLQIDFDPLDVPSDRFIDAGRSWLAMRSGDMDPMSFGIFDMRGPHMVRSNLVLDLASLNKVELLPWDAWGVLLAGQQGSPDDDAFIDAVADVNERGSFEDRVALYENDERLRVPATITSFPGPGDVRQVDL